MNEWELRLTFLSIKKNLLILNGLFCLLFVVNDLEFEILFSNM